MDLKATSADTVSGKNEPEKYIRTFAGDMDTFKKGGPPDLTPLNTVAVAGKGGHTLGQVINVPQPTPVPVAPPTIAPTQQPPASPLKTYSGDFADQVNETHASTATILAAEQDAAPVTSHTALEPARVTLPYLVASAVLLIAGIGGIYAAYTHYVSVSRPVALAPSIPTPIFVDEREEISNTGIGLMQAFQASLNRPLADGTVRLLYIASTVSASSSQATSTGNIFSTLPLSAPNVLLRNINAAGSMAGIVRANGTQSPFFILSVLSYSDTFSSMLSWEPVMPLYFADLFPPYQSVSQVPTTAPAATTTTMATTTVNELASTSESAGTLHVVASSVPTAFIRFSDMTIANHDVRAYREASGRIIFLYGYWNRTTLIIARDAAAFTEIVRRLATSRTQ